MTAALEEGRKLLNIARSDRDAFLLLASAAGIRPAIAMFLAQQTVEQAETMVETAPVWAEQTLEGALQRHSL